MNVLRRIVQASHRTLLWPALFTIALATPCITTAQNSSPPTAEQQQLIKAQTENYQAQTAKINEERSGWQKVINLSAFLAAIVAVLSLVLNYSSTLRTQHDSQFLEALKRFGDKDSRRVRSSAAGLLAKLSQQKGIIFRWRRPNFNIVFDQLMTGLRLEENSVCLGAIMDAFKELREHEPLRVLEKLRDANLKVQEDMVIALARFLAIMDLISRPKSSANNTLVDPDATKGEPTRPLSIKDQPEDKTALDRDEHWNEAAASTVYEESVLRTLARRHQIEFLSGYKSAFEEYSLMDPKRLRESSAQARRDLDLVGNRLNLNVELYSELLRADPFHHGMLRLGKYLARFGLAIVTTTNMTRVFLVNANLYGIDLRGLKFREAQLQAANLKGTDLRRASLYEAKLQGATLDWAKLQESHLSFARLEPLELRNRDGTIRELKRTGLRWARLQGADLTYANLRGANIVGADFKDATLSFALLYAMATTSKNPYVQEEPPQFENSKWWEANFYDVKEPVETGKEIDLDLFNELFKRYETEIPKDYRGVNFSIATLVKQRMEEKKLADDSTSSS